MMQTKDMFNLDAPERVMKYVRESEYDPTGVGRTMLVIEPNKQPYIAEHLLSDKEQLLGGEDNYDLHYLAGWSKTQNGENLIGDTLNLWYNPKSTGDVNFHIKNESVGFEDDGLTVRGACVITILSEDLEHGEISRKHLARLMEMFEDTVTVDGITTWGFVDK